MVITGSLIISKSVAVPALSITGSAYFTGSSFIASASTAYVGNPIGNISIAGNAMTFKGNTVDFSNVTTVTLGSNVTATPAAHTHPIDQITGIVPSTAGGTGLALDKDNITHFCVPTVTNVPAGTGGGAGTEGTAPGGSLVYFRPSRILVSGSTNNSADWKMAVNVDTSTITSQVYTLYVNGTLGVKDTITELSTRTIKKNIVELGDELTKLKQLVPVEYDYIETDKHSIGFIAEEFNEVYPSLVVSDGDGNPNSIAYQNLVSPIVKAIQQISDKLDDLTRRVEELENK